MISILAQVTLASEDDVQKCCAAARTCIESTSREEGSLHYVFSRDIVDPMLIRIAEVWKDKAALKSHMETPHLGALIKAFEKINIISMVTKVYDSSNEREFSPAELA
jgi:quinol monooxygenase YgiN